MKIIRLCTVLDFGGLEQRLVSISRVEDEHEWVFCALGTGGEAAQQIAENGKRVVLLETEYRIPSIKAIQRLIEFFKKERPDIVHTSGAEANFHGIVAAKIAGVKGLISEEIGIPNQKFAHKILFRLLYGFPSYVLANALPVGKYLRDFNGVSSAKLRIISNPIEFSSSKIIKSSSGQDFQILTVSRLKAVKNIDGVLRVLARLRQDGISFKFTVIGGGDHFRFLKALVDELALKDLVDFKGYVPDPFSVVDEVDLFVLNSFSEGFSNSLAEAMSAGIPSLATDVGVAADLIRENETGWLVRPGNEEDLFQKLKFLLSLDRERLSQVGKRGQESIRGRFSLQRHRDQLMEIYQS
jgi:glycosyltransferase involved in cell wall biosynthesis